MRPLSNAARRALQQTPSRLSKTTRRFASDGHGPHHSEPVNESFGKGFWIAVAVLPVSAVVYKMSSSEKPFLTRWIESYGHWQNKWAETNALRTSYIQQAREERNIFVNSDYRAVSELNGAELFNTGSPYAVPAGHGINLDKVREHYANRNREVDAKVASKVQAREQAAAQGKA